MVIRLFFSMITILRLNLTWFLSALVGCCCWWWWWTERRSGSEAEKRRMKRSVEMRGGREGDSSGRGRRRERREGKGERLYYVTCLCQENIRKELTRWAEYRGRGGGGREKKRRKKNVEEEEEEDQVVKEGGRKRRNQKWENEKRIINKWRRE